MWTLLALGAMALLLDASSSPSSSPSPSPSPSPSLAPVPPGLPTLTPAQQASARAVVETFRATDLGPALERVKGALLQGALVNAWHESRLVADAVGDNGNSYGLFQAHVRGAGAGHDPRRLIDPHYNTWVILQQAMHAERFGVPRWDIPPGYLSGMAANGPVSAAYAWTVAVERPARMHDAARERADTAREWFRVAAIGDHA